jgi:hypothetical protein
MPDNQVFQHWIFLIDCHDEFLQICSRDVEADTTDAITLPQSKDCSFFIFCGDAAIFLEVIDDEWKGR